MFVAGVFCAVVSHPADTIVSKLNQQKGSSFMQVGKSLGFLGINDLHYAYLLFSWLIFTFSLITLLMVRLSKVNSRCRHFDRLGNH